MDAPGAGAAPADPLCVVTTTVPQREQGLALAREAVAQRLAACVQVDGAALTAVYRWEGAVCEDTEWRVTFKTRSGCEAALRALVAARHPYAVPQWVVCPAQADAGYEAWVRTETGGHPSPG